MSSQHTPEQKNFLKAVKTTTDNLALMARAGTGKTYTLVEACKVLPADERILALAFNKSIADELNERLPSHAEAKTLNALGHRAFGKYVGKQLTLNKDKVGQILKGHCKANPELWEFWSGLATIISKARLHGMVPQGATGQHKALMEDTDDNWAALIEEYDVDVGPVGPGFLRSVLLESVQMALNGEIDFDDQIYMTCCWAVRCDRYDVIFIDEAQDLSDMQHRFLDKMMDDSTRIIAVGDDRQAIYGWRGALTNSLPMLIEKYDCKTFPLTVSFRCPKNVIAVAQQDVPDIKAKEGAEDGEVIKTKKWGADTIEANSTILCRNVAPLVQTTYRLIAGGRPAVMVGRDIGKGLITLVKNICKPDTRVSIADFLERLEEWRKTETEIARAKGQPGREESTNDKADSLDAVISFASAKDTEDLVKAIDTLFSTDDTNKIKLCTIHRSKGHEWNTVYFLDEWRCPSKFALAAAAKSEKGKDALMQEFNLRYVAVTRAKKKLVYIDSEQFFDSEDAPASEAAA